MNSPYRQRHRVFLWSLEAQTAALARSKEGRWSIALGDSPEKALRRLDLILPQENEIHVFASPMDWSGEYFLRQRKLLKISLESQLSDYQEIREMIAKGLPSPSELEYEHQRILESFSDRDLEKILRSALRQEALSLLESKNSARIQTLMAKANRPAKMLLHVCCGPDAAGVIQQLKEDFDLTCFWYDPNIQPKQEYDLRLEAFVKVAEMEKVPYIVGEYDVNSFYVSIAGLESTPEQGAKCSKCYDMRLERTALEARNQGFDFYATTLAISPHKVQRKLIAFGELNQKRYGVEYYHRNFMKGDGFKRSVELTEAYEIYRQDYCGCYFSLHEGGTAAQWLNTQLLPQNLLVSQERPYSIAEETFASYQQLLKASLKQDKNLPRKG